MATTQTQTHDHAHEQTHEHRTSDTSTPPNEEKLEEGYTGAERQIENIRTVSRVPGNPHYYEKDGLRTYGDDEDHDHEPPVSVLATMCGILETDSPIPDDL